jgi:hypothetical protein
VRLYFMALGSETGLHTPNTAESQLFIDGHRKQSVQLLPGSMITVDTRCAQLVHVSPCPQLSAFEAFHSSFGASRSNGWINRFITNRGLVYVLALHMMRIIDTHTHTHTLRNLAAFALRLFLPLPAGPWCPARVCCNVPCMIT